MPLRGLEYTPRKRACIVALHEEGLSIREIAAKGFGKKSGIANVIKRHADTLTVFYLASQLREDSKDLENLLLIGMPALELMPVLERFGGGWSTMV